MPKRRDRALRRGRSRVFATIDTARLERQRVVRVLTRNPGARASEPRERLASARAPGRARAKKSAQKSPKFLSLAKLREPAVGARARTSRRERNPSEWIAVWCTKISSEPSSGVMNPNPFWVLNHFTCARRRRRGESVTRNEDATIEQSIGCCFARQSAARSAAPEFGKRARGDLGRGSFRAAPRASYLAGELRHRVSRWELRRRERRACCNGAVGG
jgi:hypothetical protein